MTTSIIISEKGGAERRESYDQPEVSIGRVKGNDILLPKGNVSKRHARLIFRDGRCIVTDLKSTNGTYVNHRRITHATLVREGDRIYIGDFVLRLEPEASATHDLSRTTLGSLDAPSEPNYASAGVRGPLATVASAPPLTPEVVSHFPIEHDPDESSPLLQVPAPPRLPEIVRPASLHALPMVTEAPSAPELATPSTSSEPASPATASSNAPSKASRPDSERLAAHQQALSRLSAAVEAKVPIDAASPVSDALLAAIDAESARLANSPEGASLDLALVRAAALRELVGLGPLALLLEDPHVTEIHVLAGELTVVRRGQRQIVRELGFTSDHAIARVVQRLLGATAPDDGEAFVHGVLDGGLELSVVRPVACADGHLVSLRKPVRCEGTLNGLVRSGAISRGMATLLGHCAGARANILVTSSPGAGAEEVLAALSDAPEAGSGRVMWLSDGRQLPPPQSAAVAMGRTRAERLRALRAACRFAPHHLVVPTLGAEEIAVLIDAVAEGLQGVILRAAAPTLRQTVARLSADLASCSAGGSTEAAQERLLSAFDLVLEVARLRDGRPRMLRLAELRSGVAGGIHITDIFSFAQHRTAAGGSIEGTFAASGAVPAIVEELTARGLPLDTSIFRRHASG